MKFKIYYILILFLTILTSVFFAGKFKKKNLHRRYWGIQS